MRNGKATKITDRSISAGPVAGAVGFALLGAALLRFLRRSRQR